MRPCLTVAAAVLMGAVSAHPAGSPQNQNAISNQTITGSFATTITPEPSVRVISWNIDRGYHLDRVIDTLRKERPSICLLQEVDLHDRRTGNRDIARQVAQTLHYNYAYGIAFEELSQRVKGQPAFQGQATLATTPIIESRVLRFAHQSNFWRPHAIIPDIPLFQRRLGGRIALITKLSIAGSPVVVYNLHLESRSGGRIQSAQLQEVFEDLKRYSNGTPAIIGGDFNSKYFPARLLHTLEQAGFHSVLGQKVERTHVILGSLDWIFIRGPWPAPDGKIVRGTHASDHDEVIADLLRNTKRKKP
ncbi:MAG TPA: endonuclease/exonuclease/phosphatase family protein [Bryobacteraceae bacterium]|nr:endonuclease/exonuclease/phosphatase family protein [Bryobacteraceae bacterium]